jgi:4-hydroxybenzoate polyprenyltransferase
MVEFLYQLAKAARVRQWLKNGVVFAAIIFAGQFFNPVPFWNSFAAAVIFCLLSSGIYLLNDIVDVNSDRTHPFKKFRPIAAGKISIPIALTISIICLLSALSLSFVLLPKPFFFVVIGFLILQFAYIFYLKHIALLDVIAIALAFIIRVFAGETATGFHINIWLFFTIVSLSLFLALGKRRGELTLLTTADGILPKTRATLLHYSEKMLDVYLSMFSTATWLTYAFYAFLAEPLTVKMSIGNFFEENLFMAAADRKWLMLTVPLVIYGVMRYLQLIYEKHEGESPEKVLLSDNPLLLTIALWGLMVFVIVYGVGK